MLDAQHRNKLPPEVHSPLLLLSTGRCVAMICTALRGTAAAVRVPQYLVAAVWIQHGAHTAVEIEITAVAAAAALLAADVALKTS